MKKLPLPLLLILAGALALPLCAAEDASTPKAAAPFKFPTADINFPGGTLGQLTTMLARTPEGSLNIIGDSNDLNIQLPPFAIQNAHAGVIAMALNRFLETRGLTLLPSGGNVPNTKDVYVVRRIGDPTMRSRDNFESLQLAPYLEQHKIDDIIGAIRAAWELDPTHDAAALRLKFHPPTSILLVSGPPEATLLTQKVVATLKRPSEPFYAPGAKSEPTPKPAPAEPKR
jgi:hypothetical protein